MTVKKTVIHCLNRTKCNIIVYMFYSFIRERQNVEEIGYDISMNKLKNSLIANH